jgi:hypothetical protein
MRAVLACFLLAVGGVNSAYAQHSCSQHTRFVAGCAACAQVEASCAETPPAQEECRCKRCQNRVQAPPAPAQAVTVPVAAVPQGTFAQPPATGTVRGPVNQVGIEGAELRFPEMSLRLPSLRLPTLSRFRQDARMDIDNARAPFVSSPTAMPVAAPTAMAAMPSTAAAAAPVQMQQMPTMSMPLQMPAQQPSAPLNFSIAATPAAEQPRAMEINVTPEQLQDLLDKMRARTPPQESPPQVPHEVPSCNSQLQDEIRDLRQQIRTLEQQLRETPVPIAPGCEALPSCEATPARKYGPAQGPQHYPPPPMPRGDASAPWPTPVPDMHSSRRQAPAVSPVSYTEPQQPAGPPEVRSRPTGEVAAKPKSSRLQMPAALIPKALR